MLPSLAGDRDNWADARKEMEQDIHNWEALREVDSALFVLTLDDSKPETHEEVCDGLLPTICIACFYLLLCVDVSVWLGRTRLAGVPLYAARRLQEPLV